MVGKSGKVQDLNCNHQVDTDVHKSMVSEAEKFKLIQYLKNTAYRIREKYATYESDLSLFINIRAHIITEAYRQNFCAF